VFLDFVVLSFMSSVLTKRLAGKNILETRSHPEMVGDMSHVTLNFDLSKIPFVPF